jgi:hypothetical protein
MPLIKHCLICGKEFSCRPCLTASAKYCSISCQKYAQKKTGFKLCLPSGCIEWLGGRRADGYRWFRIPGGKQVIAHRWFWEGEYGPIPKGYVLHHICQNPACVNPDHLELVTKAQHRTRHLTNTLQARTRVQFHQHFLFQTPTYLQNL